MANIKMSIIYHWNFDIIPWSSRGRGHHIFGFGCSHLNAVYSVKFKFTFYSWVPCFELEVVGSLWLICYLRLPFNTTHWYSKYNESVAQGI